MSQKDPDIVCVHAHVDGKFVFAGALAYYSQGKNSHFRFKYSKKYLSLPGAFSVDPVQLPLSEGVFHTPRHAEYFNGIRDACPDSWGKSLLQLAAQKANIVLREVDSILHAGPDRIGALGFSADRKHAPFSESPPWGEGWCGQPLDLQELAEAAEQVAAERDLPDKYRRLVVCGSSAGGAKPKAACRLNEIAYLAKFRHPEDAWHACRAEHACMSLAKECGIDAAATSLMTVVTGGRSESRDVLLVRRFDREMQGDVERRIPFASQATLCGLPEQAAGGSYQGLAMATRRPFYDPASAAKDRKEIFRRMCFNALAGNGDDHVRNHGFLYGPGGWRLSPAYDVAPFLPRGVLASSQSMGRFGGAMTKENILSATSAFDLGAGEAEALFSGMARHVASRWEDAMRACHVPSRELPSLAQCFALAMQEGGAAPALSVESPAGQGRQAPRHDGTGGVRSRQPAQEGEEVPMVAPSDGQTDCPGEALPQAGAPSA